MARAGLSWLDKAPPIGVVRSFDHVGSKELLTREPSDRDRRFWPVAGVAALIRGHPELG